MNSNYVADIQLHVYSTCIADEQLVSVDMYPSTSCIRIQVSRPGHMYPGDMCPDVNAA